MSLLVLRRGSAVFGFKAACEICLRGEPDRFRRIPDRLSGQQVLQGFGQAVGPYILRGRAAGQRFELALQLALAYVQSRGHLA